RRRRGGWCWIWRWSCRVRATPHRLRSIAFIRRCWSAIRPCWVGWRAAWKRTEQRNEERERDGGRAADTTEGSPRRGRRGLAVGARGEQVLRHALGAEERGPRSPCRRVRRAARPERRGQEHAVPVAHRALQRR